MTVHSSTNVVQVPVTSIAQDEALQAIPMMPELDFHLLCKSVAQKGIQDPLWLRESGGKLILVNGRNRLAAALKLRLAAVPCIVKPSENPLEDALDSAFARRNLTKTGMAYTLFKVYPGIADRDDKHDSHTSFSDKGRTGVHKMDTRGDKGPTIRSLSEKYGLHPDYLCSVIAVMKACRPKSTDAEKVEHMILEEAIGHQNLMKGLMGWQASHPIGDEADPAAGETARRAPVNVADGMLRSFTFIRNQSAGFAQLTKMEQAIVMDDFARTWVLLPPAMQAYAMKQGKTKDYEAAWEREKQLRKKTTPEEAAKRFEAHVSGN